MALNKSIERDKVKIIRKRIQHDFIEKIQNQEEIEKI
jgi:hypothetical protein